MATEKRILVYFDELVMAIARVFKGRLDDCIYSPNEVLSAAQGIKPVDAVEVVRCKDCKHYDNTEGIQWCSLNSKFAQCGTDWHSFPEEGFCSYGERRINVE